VVAREDLRHQHGDGLRLRLEGSVRVPVAPRSGHADLLAVRLDVGGDEDQRKVGMVIVGLQVGNGRAEAFGEVAIFRFGDRLVGSKIDS